MYRVICDTYGKEYVLMDLRDEQYSLINPVLTIGLNIAGTFTFSIPPTHPNRNCIVKLASKIKVYRILKDGTQKWLFTGRSMTDEHDFYNTGRIECEGILAYLIDSVVRPYEFSGSPADYFTQLIESHNSQVEVEKQFVIGSVDIIDADNNNYITRASQLYPSTYNEIAEKIVNNLGCYLYATEADGKQYINCTMLPDGDNTQVIRFGDNLIDLARRDTAEELKTVIIPLGRTDENGNYLTIKSVNNDIDYVEDETAVNIYGRIVGVVTFDDVTLPENLIKKGRAYLKEVLAPFSTITVNAVDMSLKSEEIEALELGYVQVISKPHNLDKRILLSQIKLCLLDAASDEYTLGATETSMTASMASVNRLKADVAEKIQNVKKDVSTIVEEKVENATQLITGAKGGYVLIDDDGEKHPWRILIMDNADKDAAQNVIQLNKNGIGFSTTGINGTYANAWTIDGNLVADFITAGTMYADRISGGTLTMGGVDNKAGVIQILNGSGAVIGEWNKDGISIKDGTIEGSTINGNEISGGTIKGATISGNNISGGTIKGATIEGNEISGGTISGTTISGGTISGTTVKGSKFESGDSTFSREYIKIDDGVISGGQNGNAGYISFAAFVSGKWNIKMNSQTIGLFADKLVVGDKDSRSYKTGQTTEVTVVVDSSGNTKKLTFTKGLLTGVS